MLVKINDYCPVRRGQSRLSFAEVRSLKHSKRGYVGHRRRHGGGEGRVAKVNGVYHETHASQMLGAGANAGAGLGAPVAGADPNYV